MQENYLAKWLNGELTEAELREFENSGEYESYRHLIEVTNALQAPDFDAEAALRELKSREELQRGKVVRMRSSRQLIRVAAAIAVLFAISYFYIGSLDERVSTDYAERSEVILPDASEVIMNADSELSWDEDDWNDERLVSLEGEAFFKVAKGETFTVATEAGSITVLGTQFNVEQREGFFEVSCYEGLVRVVYGDEEMELAAGDSFVAFNGTKERLALSENDNPSWIEMESSFRSIPLKFVLAEFERQYDVEVKTSGVDTRGLFTGTFSNTNINLALESISSPSQLKFELDGKNVLFYAEETP